jgi:hypothetical protein
VPDPADDSRSDRPADARHLIGSFIGMTGMACVLFVVLASGLVAPLWAVALMSLVWLVLLVVGTRWFMTHPWRVAALPVVVLVVWFAAVSAGAAFLGWTA